MNNNEKELLKETYHSSKMAVETIETVLPKIYNEDLAYDLNKQLTKFNKIKSKAHKRLNDIGEKPVQDGLINKAMLWSSVQANTLMNTSTGHIADMMVKGNTRGVSDILKTIRRQNDIGDYAVELANELMDFEVENIERLKSYMK